MGADKGGGGTIWVVLVSLQVFIWSRNVSASSAHFPFVFKDNFFFNSLGLVETKREGVLTTQQATFVAVIKENLFGFDETVQRSFIP